MPHKEITNRCRRADCANCLGTVGVVNGPKCRCPHHKTGVELTPRPKGVGIRRFLAGISDRRRERARARLDKEAPAPKAKRVLRPEEAREIINLTTATDPRRRGR